MTVPYHERLKLENFTAFSNQTLEFVPQINVLVGENGTGKTHVLKALYAWQMTQHLAASGSPAKYDTVFMETYGVETTKELQRTKKMATVSGKYGDTDWLVGFLNSFHVENRASVAAPRPVFIPAIEMMAHARNMNGILRDYADFDRTCFDFVAMVTADRPPERSHPVLEQLKSLKNLVPGDVVWDKQGQRFFLSEKGKTLPYSIVAEGVRKVTALYRLVEFNWLASGGVLFWDEPEVNINPLWMDEIIKTLVLLAQSGIQIFLATHSYVVLKQIDLTLRAHNTGSSKEVQARFFSLYKERAASKAMWADNFADLRPNSILDQYDRMLVEDWRLADSEEKAR